MSSSRPVFRSRWLPYLLVAPQLVITVIFFIWPAGEALWYSVQSVDPFGLSSQFVGLDNFTALFHDSYYLDSFWTTIKFSALVTVSGLVASLFFAALVDYVVRGSRLYQTLMLLPYAVAPAVAAVLWIFLFNPGRGLITHFLGEFGYDWNHAQNSGQAMFLVVFASVWKQISYNFLFFFAALQSIPRSLVEAAFSQLSAERSFASLSLREVAREAGIAPTSFYRHFRDVDELGLTMVDESGLMLRQLMRQARQRIAKGGSVIRTSVSTFMEFIGNNPNAFRLLLRERSGTSAAFRAAVAREIQHFIAELADYLELENHMPRAFTEAQAEAMVTIVFSAGAEALDVSIEQRKQLEERLVLQLRMISKGAYYWYRREQEKLAHQNDE